MYLTAIIDIYSKYIVGWSISNTMDRRHAQTSGKTTWAPKYINSDQGSQFTSDEYTEYVKSLKETEISMDGKGRATDNAHIERFFITIKYDKLYLAPSTDGTHLYQRCSEFIEYYNKRRGHSSHKYETPNSVYQQVA